MMSFTEVFLLMFGATIFFLHHMKFEILKNKFQRLEEKVKRLEKELNESIQVDVIEYSEHDLNERW